MSYQYPDGSYTTDSGIAAYNQLSSAGYHAFNNVNVGASGTIATGYAFDDAIWVMAGHANAGLMEARNWQGANYVYADAHVSNTPATNCVAPNTCLNGFTVSQLHQIRLMMFAGCHSANSNNGYVLPQVAFNKGVDSSIGWTGTLDSFALALWMGDFFYYATHGFLIPATVFQSAVAAEEYVYAKDGTYLGTDTSKVWGPSVKLTPIGYGS